jgi:hypothetical protein
VRAVDPSAVVARLQGTVRAVGKNRGPHDVAIAFDDGVRAAELVRFVWIEGRVDASKNHGRAAFPRLAAYFIPAKCVERVDADADDVAGRDGVEVDRIERLVDDARIAVLPRRRRGEHVEPARSDDCGTKRDIARVHEMNCHELRTKST